VLASSFMNVRAVGKFCGRCPGIVVFSVPMARSPVRRSRRPGPAVTMFHGAAELPRDPGAYVLLIELDRRLPLDLPAFRGAAIAPGIYGYCGSAYGFGGIRARVAHHLRQDKAVRWHVDRLTLAGRVSRVGIRLAGHECDLVGTLLDRGGDPVLPGFGSSDCRGCPAHLLRLPCGGGLPEEIFDRVIPKRR